MSVISVIRFLWVKFCEVFILTYVIFIQGIQGSFSQSTHCSEIYWYLKVRDVIFIFRQTSVNSDSDKIQWIDVCFARFFHFRLPLSLFLGLKMENPPKSQPSPNKAARLNTSLRPSSWAHNCRFKQRAWGPLGVPVKACEKDFPDSCSSAWRQQCEAL